MPQVCPRTTTPQVHMSTLERPLQLTTPSQPTPRHVTEGWCNVSESAKLGWSGRTGKRKHLSQETGSFFFALTLPVCDRQTDRTNKTMRQLQSNVCCCSPKTWLRTRLGGLACQVAFGGRSSYTVRNIVKSCHSINSITFKAKNANPFS